MNLLTNDQLSVAIGRLYECCLDPSLWSDAIEQIRVDLGFHNAMLAVNLLPSGKVAFEVSTGVPQAWLDKVGDYAADIIEGWGGYERMLAYPLYEPIVHTQAMAMADLEKNRYVREWVQPQGINDAVAIAFSRTPAVASSLAMGRHRDAGPVTDEVVADLRLLIPHIRRALAISELLDYRTIQIRALLDTLDGLSSGVILVDERARVVFGNGPAQALLAERRFLHTVDQSLTLENPVLTRRMREAVGAAAHGTPSLAAKPFALPLRDRSGAAVVLHLLPLPRGGATARTLPGAVAALFVSGAAEPSVSPAIDALSVLYDLTPAEARVLDLVVQGLDSTEIAARIGVKLTTVKTHLKRLFDKTGCRRQIDLVRRVHELRSPIQRFAPTQTVRS